MILHELGNQTFSFFSTKKFRHEEELEVFLENHGDKKKYELEMNQCHEQISSGRIMTSLPQDGQALPTRTFYRCFANIISLVAIEPPVTEGAEAPVVEAVVAAAPELVAVPDLAAAVIAAEELKAA